MGDGHHGWAAAELVLLVRNLLFFEEEDRLVLTPIFPRNWAQAGQSIAVERAPTFFGPFNFRIDSAVDKIDLHLEGEFEPSLSRIDWHLPFPVDRAQGDGGPIEVLKNRLVIPVGTSHVEVRTRREQVLS